MAAHPKISLDLPEYEQRVRADSDGGVCFICQIVAGDRDDHLILFRDDVPVADLDALARRIRERLEEQQ